MVKQGAQGYAYIPVVAGGPRGVTLHYTSNNMPLSPQDNLVLIDAGAVHHFFFCLELTKSFDMGSDLG